MQRDSVYLVGRKAVIISSAQERMGFQLDRQTFNSTTLPRSFPGLPNPSFTMRFSGLAIFSLDAFAAAAPARK